MSDPEPSETKSDPEPSETKSDVVARPAVIAFREIPVNPSVDENGDLVAAVAESPDESDNGGSGSDEESKESRDRPATRADIDNLEKYMHEAIKCNMMSLSLSIHLLVDKVLSETERMSPCESCVLASLSQKVDRLTELVGRTAMRGGDPVESPCSSDMD
jgi:hypothetical protein